MPIYSSNRTGSMIESAVKGYTCNDFGRIMYESQLNDMAFFEAALNCDFNEIKGLREGTILEAEVKSLNEEAKQGWWAKRTEAIKKFMGKIATAIRDAIDRIALYVTTDGKKFIDKFKNDVNSRIGGIKNWKGNVSDVVLYKTNDKMLDIESVSKKSEFEDKVNQPGAMEDFKDMTKDMLSGCADAKEFNKKLAETTRETITVNSDNINRLLDTVSTAKNEIKELKNLEKTVNKAGNDFIKDVSEGFKKNKDEDVKNYVNFANSYVTTFEKCTTIKVRAKIGLIRTNLKTSKGVLHRVLSEIMYNANHESAKIPGDAFLEFDNIMTCSNPINESNIQAVRAVIAAAC